MTNNNNNNNNIGTLLMVGGALAAVYAAKSDLDKTTKFMLFGLGATGVIAGMEMNRNTDELAQLYSEEQEVLL